MRPFLWLTLAALIAIIIPRSEAANAELRSVPLQSRITRVQPMTGIVLWDDSGALKRAGDAVQLEFSYLKYSDVVSQRDEYDWSKVDAKLAAIAARGHQAILRFYFTYVGKPTTVPAYIKALPDYRETEGRSEKKATSFPDWTNAELQRFTIDFYEKFAARYDRDPRLAFLETGFGLWAEYHIYDGPFELGRTFPSKAFQSRFLRHLDKVFRATPWMISVDAVDANYSPIAAEAGLLGLGFGVFDDSFLAKEHARVNEKNWDAMDRARWLRAPAGGEFSYYTKHDQQTALAAAGPHGESFEAAARRFHITFIIGNDQPRYVAVARIREAGMACGYQFRVESFRAGASESRVIIVNEGVAPLYHDAFPAVNGVRAGESLKLLAPGERREFRVAAGGANPKLTIESDHLVTGQRIEFEADLK